MALDKYETPGAFTWTCPAGVRLAGIGCIGGGGGGKSGGANSNGGGGGAAFSTANIAVNPGNIYNLVVAAGGGLDADGGASSFNTTSVIAAGGKKGSTRTGGATVDCTGTTKRAGGNGGAGDGAVATGGGGGGAAGTSAGGSNGTAASGVTPGTGGPGGAGTMAGGTGGNGQLLNETITGPAGYGSGAGGSGGTAGAGNPGSVWIQTNAAPVTIGSTIEPGNYRTGDVLTLSVQFDQTVTVVTSGGTPYVSLVLTSGSVHAVYASGSDSDTLLFTYTIQSGDGAIDGDVDGAGIGVYPATAITLNGGTISSTPLTTDADLTITPTTPSQVYVNLDETDDQLITVIFKTAGASTWKCPSWVEKAAISCVGGGGGGGCANLFGNGGPGGGGGAGATYSVYETVPSQLYNVRVGAGGSGAIPGSDPVAARNGSASRFNNIDASPGDVYAAGGLGATLVGGTGGSRTDSLGSGTDNQAESGGGGGLPDDKRADAGGGGGGGGGSGDGVFLGGRPGVSGFGFAGGAGGNTGQVPPVVAGGAGGTGGPVPTAGAAGVAPGGGGGGAGGGPGRRPVQTSGGNGAAGSVTIIYRKKPLPGPSVSGPPAGDYATGQSLGVIVTFDVAVDVTGTPQIALTIGGNTRQAVYTAGTGSRTLYFAYVIVGGDTDTDGIACASVIALNGGTIKASGDYVSTALLTFTAPAVSSVFVNRPGTETFNASTTWTCPTGVTSIDVECWGAGGGGSNGVAIGGNGGGGGAYSKKAGFTVTPGNDYTVTVGAAGAAGAPGTAGGDTSFNTTTCKAKGGSGGAGSGAGGLASGGTGDTKNSGGNAGTTGLASGAGGGSSAGTAADGGNGGNSAAASGGAGGTAPSGGAAGGRGGDITTNSGITAGTAPGGGGGGGSAAHNGAAGTAGRVKITYAGAAATESPRILRVTPPADDTVFTGNVLSFTVVYNEAVTVTGTPRIALTVGATSRYATYASGSGTASLVFSYTVVAGDVDTAGVGCVLDSPIDLNGGTMANGSAIAATLTFTEPDLADLQVNFFDPDVEVSSANTFTKAGTYKWICPGGVTTVTVKCWGAGACGNGDTSFDGGGGGAYATSAVGVTPGQAYDIVIGAGGTAGARNGENTIFGNNSVIAAGAVGSAGGTVASSTGTTRRVGGAGGTGQGPQTTRSGGGGGGSSAGTAAGGNVGADATAGAGGNGGTAPTNGGAGGPGAGENNGGAGEGSRPAGGGGGGARGFAAGKGADGRVELSYSVGDPVTLDFIRGSEGSYREGQTITYSVLYDQSVTVTGTPRIAFLTRNPRGAQVTRYLDYVSGSGSATLVFRYTVQSATSVVDPNGIIPTTPLDLNGGTIKSSGGADASLNLTTRTSDPSHGPKVPIYLNAPRLSSRLDRVR